MTKQRVKH